MFTLVESAKMLAMPVRVWKLRKKACGGIKPRTAICIFVNQVRLACVNRVTSCAVVQPKRLHVREPRRSRSHWMVGEKDREVGVIVEM